MTPAKVDTSHLFHPSAPESLILEDHDGLPVTAVKAELTNTGSGLEEALGISPVHVPVDAEGYAIVKWKCVRHKYDKRKEGRGKDAGNTDEFVETAVIKAEAVVLADPDLVHKTMETHGERVREARAEAEAARRAARGEDPLPFLEGGDGEDESGGDDAA